MKYCSKCKSKLSLSCFSVDTTRKDGRSYICKECKNSYIKEWTVLNKESKNTKAREQYSLNKELFLQKRRTRNKENNYYSNYERNRIKTDIQFKLIKTLRRRITHVIKGTQKAGSAVSDLGCSIPHLKLHLELFFDEGMTWENHGFGNDKWNIDHIKPLASFNLTDRNQFLEACHFSNLQPLWQKDNFEKSDRLG